VERVEIEAVTQAISWIQFEEDVAELGDPESRLYEAQEDQEGRRQQNQNDL